MAGWQVTEQAIAAMNNMASQLQELSSKIHQETSNMKASFDDSRDGLGAHSDAIMQLLKGVESTEQEGSKPVAKLQLKLLRAALIRQKHIEENKYGGHPQVSSTSDHSAVSVGGSGSSTMNGTASQQQGATGGSLQIEHKPFVSSHEAAISAVQDDVLSGSGQSITRERAAEMLGAVQYFSGNNGYTPIRKAYNNPNADPKDINSLHALDDYIHSAPKWKGQVFRGISVTKSEASDIMSGTSVDMRGPASWSSEQGVAERFSNGYKDVRIVFVLDDNKSGASIAHIGSYDGAESEVTSPSGVKYHIDRIRKEQKGSSEIVFIDVHE